MIAVDDNVQCFRSSSEEVFTVTGPITSDKIISAEAEMEDPP